MGSAAAPLPPVPAPAGWAALWFIPIALTALTAETSLGVYVSLALAAAWLLRVRPHLVLWLTLTFSAADLVLTTDRGGFTFRMAQALAVVLLASALSRHGPRAYLRYLAGLPGIWCFGLMLGLHAVRLAMGVPNGGKGAGYLLWGCFDLLVLAPSVALAVARAPARALVGWVVGAALVSLFGVSQLALAAVGSEPWLVTQWVGARPRINALSYEPSYFAFQAVLVAALAGGVLVSGRLRRHAPLLTACTVVTLVAVVLSSSRSGWLGAAVLLLAVGWTVARRRRASHGGGRSARVLVVAVATLVALADLVPPHALAADRLLAERALDPMDPSSSQPRREGLVEAWRLFRSAPLLGVGPGQFGGALLTRPDLWARTIFPDRVTADELVTFNLYLELLAEGGLLGAGAAVSGLGLVWWRLHRRRRAGGLRARLASAVWWSLTLTCAVMCQFNQTLWRTELWCLMGVAWALTAPPPSPQRVRSGSA